MLASLDPLGLPICCQPIAGNRSDNPLYVPAYDAAVAALGTSDVLVVGDSKMTDLPTRGHFVASGSRYLGAYRPIHASAEIASWIADAKLEGVVQTALKAWALPDGSTAWVVAAVWVDLLAWQTMVERVGWQVYVSNTTPEHYDVAALVATYHQQPVHERSFSRLKTRNLQLRPVYVRDETRIAGLVWLLCMALRVLVLTEQRLRAALQEKGGALVFQDTAGLFSIGGPLRSWARPIAPRAIGGVLLEVCPRFLPPRGQS